VVGHAALVADRLVAPLAFVGLLGLLALAVGLVGRWSPLLQLALSLVVADYAGALLDTGKIDAWAPLVAAAFLATGELAYTSIEPPARRVWPFSLGMVVAAAGVAALLLGAAGAGGGHLLDLALGMLAAAGALAIVARLASTASRG
jgi:hypothetical protein